MHFLNKQKLKDLSYIFRRNIFLLTNGIIVAVVFCLYIFGDTQAALFLGFILFLNMFLGLAQDIRAWVALENLQLLTAPRVTRIESDRSERSILVEEIEKGDFIKLKTGDQVPCDGTLIETSTLELNEGLITGESASISRNKEDHVLAGSIITSGSGVMRIDVVFKESRIARMTEGIKTYATNLSPIQKDVGKVIAYAGYVLMAVIVFVIVRGTLVHDSNILIVKNIGALASVLVPQGLIFAMTLLFAYGAAHLFNRNVLLQEINATEKLGRIRNLCMDKTGTLTENTLTVERMEIPAGFSREQAEDLANIYVSGAKDSSQTMTAIEKFLPPKEGLANVVGSLPFSSWRPYGAVQIARDDHAGAVIVAGAPESLLPYLSKDDEKEWLHAFLNNEAKEGKRIFSLALSEAKELSSDFKLGGLSLVAVFIIGSKLRPGIEEAIDFFQKRGVRIRIISGDSKETVRSIAMAAGVNECNKLTTGSEMALWSDADFMEKAKDYTIFARTVPEQKEKLVEAFKKDGFTAMVGDGANDALALKKSDLGIAMFEGAPATRQVASVVLMNNSFTALPGGVSLADSIIKNAEIFASIFFCPTFTGFFFFIIVSLLGYPFPITPLNITLINYFTVGIPGLLISYWTLRPAGKVVAPSADSSLLGKILPFVLWSSLLQAVVLGVVFYFSPEYMKGIQSNLLVILMYSLTGFIFFLFAAKAYRGSLTGSETYHLWCAGALEIILLFAVFQIPFLLRFFDIVSAFPALATLMFPIIVGFVYVFLQYLIKRKYVIY